MTRIENECFFDLNLTSFILLFQEILIDRVPKEFFQQVHYMLYLEKKSVVHHWLIYDSLIE